MNQKNKSWVGVLLEELGIGAVGEINARSHYNTINSIATDMHPLGMEVVGGAILEAGKNGGHHSVSVEQGTKEASDFKALVEGEGSEVLQRQYSFLGNHVLTLSPSGIRVEKVRQEQSQSPRALNLVNA